ncbi:MAG: Uma2 family endonuclease [Leptolyngbyaceae bacterium]|nr:Uma2 family endonuclease [Leptolyngbyaceae bacterium]
MLQISRKLTLQEFLATSEGEGDLVYELVDGQAVPKMSPRFFHASLTLALLSPISRWCQGWGRVRANWAVILTRQGQDWAPVPDLLYVSHQRLPATWLQDEACPAIPELVVEITSPRQSFGGLAGKARDYLDAGVLRVWIIDSQARSVTVFYPDAPPQTYTGETLIADPSFTWLKITAEQIFQQAGIPYPY